MLMILARLVRSESFWAVVKVRSPHNRPEVWYPREAAAAAEAEGGCLCPASICHRERESCAHLGRCRIIAHLFSRIKLIIPDTPAPSRDRILFCYVEDQRLPLVTTTLCLLLWKFTLIDFYRVDIDNVTFKADDVWTATLTRLVHAAASKCVHIRSLRRRYHSRGEQPPPRFLDRFQLLVAPLSASTGSSTLVRP